MGVFQDYEKYCSDFTYLESWVQNIIAIFEGSGKSQIVTKETIKNSNKRIQDFLILSPQMENALKYIYSELKEIKNSPLKFSGGMFYFSRYGGSKTQFLNLVLNEIQVKLPDCIVVLFQDIEEISPLQLFNKIKQTAYYSIPNLSRFKNDEQKYLDLINSLESISTEISVDLRQSSNLDKILHKIGFVKNRLNKNPKLKKELENTIEILHTSIFVDSESIVKKILDFMKVLTNNGFLFLFLYDEVDLWIDETSDQLLFSKKFIRLEKILKYILESSQHEIRLFHLFACTERVNTLIKDNQHIYSESSSAGSRFIQIYNRSEHVPEPGNYGDNVEKALTKISAFYTLANDNFKIDSNFLDQSLEKLKSKYLSYSRRLVNPQIIRLLKTYQRLKLPLNKGIKEWRSNARKYGSLIEYHLERILDHINIKFIRENILIQPNKRDSDKIDGYFINYDENENEIKTYVEIKLTKNFTGDKAYQALQWTQLRKEPIIMIIFSPNSIEEINQRIIDYAERMGFTSEDTEKIRILNISESYAFCSIIGVGGVLSNHSKLIGFYNDFAFWLDFFGDFTYKYQDLKSSLGLTYKKPIRKPDKKKKDVEVEAELTPDAHICIELLVKLYNKQKMSKSGRLAKTTIESINREYSLGISNLNSLYDIMEKQEIIVRIHPSMVSFSEDILKISHLENFVELCENKFRKKSINLISYS